MENPFFLRPINEATKDYNGWTHMCNSLRLDDSRLFGRKIMMARKSINGNYGERLEFVTSLREWLDQFAVGEFLLNHDPDHLARCGNLDIVFLTEAASIRFMMTFPCVTDWRLAGLSSNRR